MNDAAEYLVNELQQICNTHLYYVYIHRSKMKNNVSIAPSIIESVKRKRGLFYLSRKYSFNIQFQEQYKDYKKQPGMIQ